jgi:hypothetical protein
MKKYLFFLIIFFSFVLQIYGQNARIASLVNRCISLAEIYKKDDLSAIIESPRKLNNGSVEIIIGFSRNLSGLENM